MTRELSTKTIQHLKGLAHPLKPTVMVGKEGLTDAVLAAVSQALLDHELIKVRVLSEAPVERHDAAEQLAAGTKSVLVQLLGRMVVLYKRHPKKPKLLPTARSIEATLGPVPKSGRQLARRRPARATGSAPRSRRASE